MSVLIKGINVHRGRCYECPCLDGEYGSCNALKKDVHYVTKEDCPLIELPDHGDLIDRDTLMCEIADWQLAESPDEGRNWWLGKDVTSHEMQYGIYRLLGDVYEEVRDIPAVIPAERSEDGEA